MNAAILLHFSMCLAAGVASGNLLSNGSTALGLLLMIVPTGSYIAGLMRSTSTGKQR